MVDMFKWFNKNKDSEIKNTDEVTKVKNADNYETEENGDIRIKVEKQYNYSCFGKYKEDVIIPKDSIVSHTKDNIVLKDYKWYFNLESEYFNYNIYKSIEDKENLIKYKDTRIKTYEYSEKDKCWKCTKTEVVGTEVISETTPLDVFKKEFDSKYKLIETKTELNDYLSSTLDCDTWCRKKLYDKMKELGLGDGFINQFADLVGNDLDKYYAMIDLANEVSDKDTLMYLYTYKFSKE